MHALEYLHSHFSISPTFTLNFVFPHPDKGEERERGLGRERGGGREGEEERGVSSSLPMSIPGQFANWKRNESRKTSRSYKVRCVCVCVCVCCV